MMADLKPCPCCGGAANLKRFHVKCTHCWLRTDDYTHNIDAIAAWNRRPDEWQPIETAPTDGTVVRVLTNSVQELPAFECLAAYHPDAGWCVDEFREATHWRSQ